MLKHVSSFNCSGALFCPRPHALASGLSTSRIAARARITRRLAHLRLNCSALASISCRTLARDACRRLTASQENKKKMRACRRRHRWCYLFLLLLAAVAAASSARIRARALSSDHKQRTRSASSGTTTSGGGGDDERRRRRRAATSMTHRLAAFCSAGVRSLACGRAHSLVASIRAFVVVRMRECTRCARAYFCGAIE